MRHAGSFEPLSDGYARWLWAAYRKGWDAGGQLPPDLAAADFVRVVESIRTLSPESYVLIERRPVGLVLVGGGFRCEAHAEWFPWAGGVARLTAAVKFLEEMRKSRCVFVFCDERNNKFFKHIKRYGILDYKGPSKNYSPSNDVYHLYVTRKHGT